MAKLCEFVGLDIIIHHERDCQHKLPHIHIVIGAHYDVLSIGIGQHRGWSLGRWNELDGKQRKTLQTWLEDKDNELMVAWELIKHGADPGKIRPPAGTSR